MLAPCVDLRPAYNVVVLAGVRYPVSRPADNRPRSPARCVRPRTRSHTVPLSSGHRCSRPSLTELLDYLRCLNQYLKVDRKLYISYFRILLQYGARGRSKHGRDYLNPLKAKQQINGGLFTSYPAPPSLCGRLYSHLTVYPTELRSMYDYQLVELLGEFGWIMRRP